MRTLFIRPRWIGAILIGCVLVGTAPRGPGGPSFVTEPEQTPQGRWQLRWSSETGRLYRLERSHDLVQWGEVTTLSAVGVETSFTDPTPLTQPRTYWRVVLIGSGPDAVPPVVSIIDAQLVDNAGAAALQLRVRATDNVQVVGVNYAEGATQLGAATAGPTQTWTKIVPLVAGATNPRQFQAVARDAAGNTGFSEIYTFRPQQAYPSGMRPLGGAGASAAGVIGERTDGSLTPFTYMPDSNAGGSPQRALRVDFPTGAQLVTAAGQPAFQFTKAVFGFGLESPLRFDPAALPATAPLASDPLSFDGFGLALNVPAGQTRQLVPGVLSYETLRQLLGLPAGTGIPMKLFNRFPVLWKGGTFTRSGVVGGKFALPDLGLPLPPETGEYALGIFDLLSGKPAEFPIHGTWPLPGTGATIIVARARPLVLTLKPDGSVALNGPVTIQFANGVRLQGTIILDDPIYKFCLEADTLSVPLVAVLETILPNNARNCIPAGFDDATLDHSEECLRSYDRAYRSFLQAALNLRPDATADAGLGATPGPQDLAAAAAECFAATAAVDVAASLPLQAIRDFTSGWWKPSVAQTEDMLTALKNLEAIQRLHKIAAQMKAAGSNSPEEDSLLNEQAAALEDARAEVIGISQTSQASASIESLAAIAEAFVTLGVTADDVEMVTAMRVMVGTFIARVAARLNIPLGASDHRQNATLLATGYYETLILSKEVIGALNTLLLVGLGEDDLVFGAEVRRQLTRHAGDLLVQRLEETTLVGDVYATQFAADDLLDFVATLEELGVEDPELPGTAVAEAALVNIGNQLEQALLDGGNKLSEMFARSVALRASLDKLREIIPGAPNVLNAQRRVHDLMQSKLPTEAVLAAADSNLGRLLEVLSAGRAFASLARTTPGVITTYNWEQTDLGPIADHLASLCAQQLNFSLLRETLQQLFDEIDQLEKEGEQAAAAGQSTVAQARQQSRKRYLNVIADVLVATRPAILAYWQQTNTLRAQQPASAKSDGFLSGDLTIERLRGCVSYNRQTNLLTGTFGGRVGFPADGAFFEIVSATISSNGSFNIQAATQLPLEPFGNPNVSLSGTLGIAGTNAGLQSVNGTGTLALKVPAPGGGAPGSQNFSVAYSYSATAPGQPLTLTGTLITQNAPLKLGDDFVLFGGNLSATWKTGNPGGFSIGIGGKAGMFHRETPLAVPITEQDFWSVAEINQLGLSVDATKVRATFAGGTLVLAEDLFVRNTPGVGGDFKTKVTMTGQLCADIPLTTGIPSFCANGNPATPFTTAFDNFHFSIPNVPQSRIDVTTCVVEFFQNSFPVMKNLAANFQFPLPGTDATNAAKNRLVSLNVTGKDWRIDGYPKEATIALDQTLRIADLDGLDVDLLGGTALPGCQTIFSLTSQTVGGQQQARLSLDGGMRAAFEARLIDNAAQPGTGVAATACGHFAWDFHTLPEFQLSVAEIDGRFTLGGPQGVTIGGVANGQLARLSFSGIENLHRLTAGSPFTVNFTGALDVAGFVKFGLKNANLLWNGSGLLPAVTLGGVQTDLGSESVKLAQGFLPVYPTGLGAEFIDPARPLFPTAGQTGLFDPLNIRVLMSGAVSIPPPVVTQGGGSPSDLPGIGGSVDNLGIGLKRQGDLIVPDITLNGLGLSLSGLDIPPLGGLHGSLYVGNLNDPPNLYFAGSIGGTVSDVGATIGMGIHRSKGLLGAVFDLDLGPAGIPLDGGTLGGILMTGGGGGLSFGNTFAQPADFLSSIQFTQVNGEKRPVNDATTDAFPPTGTPSSVTYPTTPQAPANTANSCIIGQFPPPTINPFCKDHPTIPNRIIFKGTDLHPTIPNTDFGPALPITLASIGITPGAVPSSINAAVAFAVDRISLPVKDFRNSLVNAVPAGVDPRTKAYYASLLDKQIKNLETSTAGFLRQQLGTALGLNPNASLYDAIVAAAAQGIPCLDATLRLQGNFSHAAVSTVLKGEGAVTLSTTGTATLEGAIKLIGIPVGEGTLALSLTDSHGDVNPSFGGVLHAGVGPLTLGDMSMAYQCDGCFTAVLNSFQTFLATNGQNLSSDVRQLLVEMMNRTVPLAALRPLGGDPGGFFMELNDRQKLAFICSLFNIVEVLGNGQPLPPGIAAATVSGFVGSFQQFVSNVLTQVNPRFCFQAKVRPALFGFPLIPGADPLDARFAYERVTDVGLGQDFQQLSANARFSPAFIVSSMTSGPLGALLPTSDEASLGFSFRVPAFTAPTVDLAMRNPAQFARNQITSLVQDSTLTFGYAFMPLGIPLAQGQGRVVMPRLLNHPSNPNRAGGFPYQVPNATTLATRDEVIIAALVRGRLQDPNWRGQIGELDDLFFQPFPSPPTAGSREERIVTISNRLSAPAMNALGFAEDYFPFGGMIGAAELELPNILAQAPPTALIGKVFDVSNPTWLADAQTLFTTYLTANTVIGQMAVYTPAPNVPAGFNFATNGPQELLTSVSSVDPFSIITHAVGPEIYPFNQVMLAGWAKTQLLGMPLAEGQIRFEPATNRFALNAGVPAGSWLRSMVGASLEVSLRQPAVVTAGPGGSSIASLYAAMPKRTVLERFQQIRAQLTGTPSPTFIQNTISSVQDTLPKISAEATATFQIPTALEPMLRTRGSAGVQFFAYSPGFDRSFAPADISPKAKAKRQGGVGVAGAFEMGFRSNDGIATNDLIIDIDDASFAIVPEVSNLPFPALSGQLLAPVVQLPTLLGGSVAIRNVTVNVDTAPSNIGDPFFRLSGGVDPLDLGLFRISPLTGALVAGTFSVEKSSTAVPTMKLRGNAAKLVLTNMADSSVDLRFHGTGGESQPFIIDTAGTINAAVTLRSNLVLRDLNGSPVLTLATGATPIGGSVTNAGNLLTTVLNVPAGQQVTIHPTNQTLTLTVTTALTIRSNGEFFLDLSMPPFDFGVFHIASSQGGGNLQVHAGSDGLSVPSGAKLTLTGISGSVLDLQQFEINTDGTLTVVAQSTALLDIPDFMRLDQPPGGASSIELRRELVGPSLVTTLRLQAPRLTLFPGGNPLKKPQLSLPDLIQIDSTGRFYANVGPRTLDLFGTVQAEGTLEFGYEPAPPGGTTVFTRSPSSLSFTRPLGLGSKSNVTLTNTGSLPIMLALELTGAGAAHFAVGQSSVLLNSGQNTTVPVTFLAKGGPTAAATLNIRVVGGTQTAAVTLSGNATAAGAQLADLELSDPAFAFEQMIPGLKAGRAFILTNKGQSPIALSSISAPGAVGVAGGGGTLAPGEARAMSLTYQPGSAGSTNGNVTINTPVGARAVGVTGTAVNRTFLKQFVGDETFASMSMDAFGRGTAVDQDGQTWMSETYGWAWRPVKIRGVSPTTTTGAPINAKVLTASATAGGGSSNWLVGANGEYWTKASGTNEWTKQTNPTVASTSRTWVGLVRHNASGSPLALVVGNSGSQAVIVRETAPGTFAELTFAGTALRAITSNTADQVALAVGDSGKLLRSTTGGASFSTVSVAGATAGLLSVDMSTTADAAATRKAVIGGTTGRIFRSTNGGASWSAATITAPGFALGNIVDVKIEGARGLALDASGVLLSSGDGGANWTAGEHGFTHATIRSLTKAGGDFWAQGDRGEIFIRIPDGGLVRPPVSLSTDRIEFGLVPPNFSATRTFAMTNRGTTTLSMTVVPAFTDSTTVSPSSFSLAAGATRAVQITETTHTGQFSITNILKIGATGLPDTIDLDIDGQVRERVWTPQPSFTTEDLRDVFFTSSATGYALGSGSLFKTSNGGSTWTNLNRSGDPTYRRCDFTSSLAGWVACGVSQSGRIIKTIDGGNTWTIQYDDPFSVSDPGQPVTDISMINSSVGYATIGGITGFLGGFTKGRMLRTANGGTTWAGIAAPAVDPDFSPATLHAVSDTAVFVGSVAKLYRYDFSAGTWTVVNDNGTRVIRDIYFNDTTNGWYVGDQGLNRFTTNGGTSWGSSIETSIPGTAERVHFPGTTDGRIIANDTSLVEVWRGGGLGYVRDDVSFPITGSLPRPRAVAMRTATSGYIVGDDGLYWRYLAPVVGPDGSLSSNPEVDFGVIRETGAVATQSLTFTNHGNQSVLLRELLIEDVADASPFSATGPLGQTLASGAAATFSVSFRSTVPGRHDALVRLVTDAPVPIYRVALTGYVQSEPAAVVARTRPAGLSLTVGGASSTATVTRVVRDAGAAAGELNVGGGLALNAASSATFDGLSYAFSGWKGNAGATGNAFTYTASNHPEFLEAIYRPTFPIATVTVPGAGAGNQPPADRPFGPWVRISGAKLKIPSIDDFVVKGGCYLSGQRIKASLDSTSVRVPESTAQAAVVKMGAGSWQVDWTNGGTFKFDATSPSLEVLGREILPGSTASIAFSSNGDYVGSAALSEDFQIGNGLLEFAALSPTQPASAGFAFRSNAMRFSLNAKVRALADGDDGWLFQQDLAVTEQATLFAQPLTLATAASPINLGVFSITSGSLQLNRDANGVMSLALSGVTLSGPFGNLPGLSASVASDGTATLSSGANVDLGPFHIVPNSGLSTRFVLNVLTGDFEVQIPDCTVRAKQGEGFASQWPSNGVPVSGFHFDSSGDFNVKLDLPSLTIDGISMDGGGPRDHNFIRFKRVDGETSFTVRDRRDLDGNTAHLEFTVKNNGNLKGEIYGNWNFLGFPVGEVSMTYDSSDSNYQFRGRFIALDNEFLCARVKFGSDGTSVSSCFQP